MGVYMKRVGSFVRKVVVRSDLGRTMIWDVGNFCLCILLAASIHIACVLHPSVRHADSCDLSCYSFGWKCESIDVDIELKIYNF